MNLSYMVIAHECPISVKDMSINQLQQKKGATKMEFRSVVLLLSLTCTSEFRSKQVSSKCAEYSHEAKEASKPFRCLRTKFTHFLRLCDSVSLMGKRCMNIP